MTATPTSSALSLEFSSLPFSAEILEVVRELGYEKLTPIQAQSIPKLLEGRDLIGQSKTGSGKTAAFSLPILENLDLRGRRQLQALILCPTRELCTQVAREIRKLGRRHAGLQVLILAGGSPLFTQLGALEKGVHIAVGTPGRIIDHLSRRTLDLRSVKTVVLDEADRMLDMGFQEDMEHILSQTPTNRQTVLFSATFPRMIEAMSRAYQKSPVRVTIADEAGERAPQIQQYIYEAELDDKFKTLVYLLKKNATGSAIIFCNLKATCAELARTLSNHGVSAEAIHGDLEQFERDRVMAKFRNGSTRLLIATDVAARGIDVENLDAVYNFDLPSTPDVYTHRIGRTGRAGKKGIAISLVLPKQAARVRDLEEQTGVTFIREKVSNLEGVEVALMTEELGEAGAEAKMETLHISGGRKDKVRPGDILGALTGEAGGLAAKDVGKIEIHDRFAYVAVAKHVARDALQALTDGKIKGRKFRIHLVQ
ncbi:MAG: ATP-dependent RNA helicase DbpA [Cryobacterium sp.]|nr:ATP-dependent RNA helicase DbpA [Oligoflexia bacterium]